MEILNLESFPRKLKEITRKTLTIFQIILIGISKLKRYSKANFSKKESKKKNLSISMNYVEPKENKVNNEIPKNLSTSIYLPNSKKKEVLDKRNASNLEESKFNLTNSKNNNIKNSRIKNDKENFRKKDSFYSDENENTPRTNKVELKRNHRNENEFVRKRDYWETNDKRDYSRNICPVNPNFTNSIPNNHVYSNSPSPLGTYNFTNNIPNNSPLNFPIYYNQNTNPYQFNNSIFPTYPYYNNPYEQSWNQMTLPVPSNYQPQYTPNPIPNFYTRPEEKEGQYCAKCEDVYKQVLFSSIPLKICQCIFCNSMLNSSALEKIQNKYKKELEEHYKKKLSETLISNKLESKKSTEYFDIYPNLERTYPLENYNGEYLYPRKEYHDNFEQFLYTFPKKNTPKSNESWAAWLPTKLKKEDSIEKEEEDKIDNFIEKEEIKIGEVFKRKRKDLFEKIKIRETSVKYKKNELQNSNQSSTPKNVHKKYKSFSSESARRKDNNNTELKEKKPNDQNSESIDKLLNGEKIELNKEEIKKINKKWTSNYTDVGSNEYEQQTKQTSELRNLNSKEYNKKMR